MSWEISTLSKNKNTLEEELGVNTPLNEKLENVEWGKFSYNVLFKLCAVKNMLTKFSLDDGKVPVYS